MMWLAVVVNSCALNWVLQTEYSLLQVSGSIVLHLVKV